ncbi:MAG: transglutaminase-like domain-containing protein [archaeon]
MFKTTFCLLISMEIISGMLGEIKSKQMKKTRLEQAIWKKIQDIEGKKETETDFDKINALNTKVSFLKERLSELQGQSVSSLEKENSDLKKTLAELGEENDKLKRSLSNFRSQYASLGEKRPELHEGQGLQKLYRILLEKYSDLINSTEKKTIGEIKALLDVSDLTIQSLISEYKPENYNPETDYLPTAKKLFEFLTKKVEFVQCDLELNFWLSPKEILENQIAEAEDLAAMLCTLLLALGDEDAEVVIAEMENAEVHAFVTTEVGGKFVLLDPSQPHDFNEFIGTKSDVIQNYSFRESKIKRYLYKFNNKRYESFI